MFHKLVAVLKGFHRPERNFRRIFDSSLIGLCISDSSGIILDANDCYLDLLGVTREQMRSKKVSWKDFTDPEHIERSVRAAKELRETGQTRPFEKDYINARGERRTVLVGASRIDEHSNIGFILDLSNTRLGERLNQSEQFLETVIEWIPNMIFVKDAKSLKFVRFNKAGEELVGHERSTLIGKSDFDFFPEDQAEYFVSKDREVIKNKKVVDIPEELISTARGVRYLHTKKIPVFDASGEAQYLIGISEDITQKKAAEQQKLALLQAQAARAEAEKSAEQMALLTDKANEANRAKSAFLANISHEIRTPLGAMLGFAELALEANDPNKKAEYVQTILRNGKELLRIVDEVLDISKAESNSMEIEKIRFSLPEFLKDVGDLMIVRAKQKGLELRFSTPGALPAFVFSDPFRLRQVLLNVVGNAIKFTEQGSVTVETKYENSLLKFCVTDTGIGIGSEQAEKLFQPFTQADDSTTRKFGGTGLGLFLSRRLAMLLGGDVKILESHPGQGSCFEVSAHVQIDTAMGVGATAGSDRFHSGANLEGCEGKVMIVDDSLDNQELIAAYLASSKIKYAMASRGNQAVDMVDETYDLILMDIQMPEMDGFEALQKIREKGIKVPVIALTAHAMKGDRERCVQAGFNDYLSKPISRKALTECLSRFT